MKSRGWPRIAAAAIVSHDAFDGNAKALEVGNGGE
jgi:hypothetical protein